MDSLAPEIREEYQHFINVVYAFLAFKHDGVVDAERIYRSMQMLSEDDRAMLIEPPATRVMKIIQALLTNQRFIYTMLSCLCGQAVEGSENFDDPMTTGVVADAAEPMTSIRANLLKVVRNSPFCCIPPEVPDEEIAPTSDPVVLQRNLNWVRTTLRQFVRDWAEDGAAEREQTFQPLLDSLKQHVPIVEGAKPPRVLCPGCGLGRLPYEVMRLGYESQGNEFSFFMLIGSYFATNHFNKVNALTLYPYCLSTSNRVKHDDHLFSCRLPDVAPVEREARNDFSMCTGEFTDVYGSAQETFDAVLTCFFLDTAKNPIAYIRTCAKATRPGGLWANIGPLLYHYADFSHHSVELSWEELRPIVAVWFKIVREEWRDANYTCNQRSMMRTQYRCIYFEAIRNDVEAFGHSNAL